jgi:hypothetical protein
LLAPFPTPNDVTAFESGSFYEFALAITADIPFETPTINYAKLIRNPSGLASSEFSLVGSSATTQYNYMFTSSKSYVNHRGKHEMLMYFGFYFTIGPNGIITPGSPAEVPFTLSLQFTVPLKIGNVNLKKRDDAGIVGTVGASKAITVTVGSTSNAVTLKGMGTLLAIAVILLL